MIKDSDIMAVFLVIFSGMVAAALLYNLFTTPVLLQRVIDSIVLVILVITGAVYSVTMGRPR